MTDVAPLLNILDIIQTTAARFRYPFWAAGRLLLANRYAVGVRGCGLIHSKPLRGRGSGLGCGWRARFWSVARVAGGI